MTLKPAELAAKLREIGDTLSLSAPSWAAGEIYHIATQIEGIETTRTETAALEAKLAEWREVGADAKRDLEEWCEAEGADHQSLRMIARLSDLLTEPDPHKEIAHAMVSELFPEANPANEWALQKVALAALKRGIELGAKP